MYAKIFNQIFDSSLAEDYETRHVFMDLLVLADPEGLVDMTLAAIGRRTNIPVKILERHVKKLCAPDPQSKLKDHEGRRLIMIDPERAWGWRIVNFLYYHGVVDENAKRKYHRLYMQRRRAKQKREAAVLRGVKTCEAKLRHVDVDVDVDKDLKEDLSHLEPTAPPFDLFQETWNRMAKANNLSETSNMTAKRKKSLKARWRDESWRKDWQHAIAKIPYTPFLLGQNKRGWKANADFFLRPDSVTRIMEDFYRGNGE